MGVDVAKAVKRVVATHWHDDHVRGMTQTMKECESAKFICPQAMFSKEFVAFTNLWKKQHLIASPVSELAGVIETVAQSTSALKGSSGDSRVGFAIANRCLWQRPDSDLNVSGELHSLSPSDSAVKKSLEEIASLFSTGKTLTRPIPSSPNQFSIVLWLRVGEVRLLLGADMEERSNPFGGWTLIVESTERPTGKASLFKVPHHGSVTGECKSVWNKLLLSQPVALLTPFHSGSVKLPKVEDAQRIYGSAQKSFITAGFDDRSSRGKTGSANRTIHQTVRYIKKANGSFGHVRARKKLSPESESWSVSLFGDAKPLNELYAKKSV